MAENKFTNRLKGKVPQRLEPSIDAYKAQLQEAALFKQENPQNMNAALDNTKAALSNAMGIAKEELEVKFLRRAKGVLQNRAAALQEQLPALGGAEIVAEVARIGRHAGQLVLEFEAEGLKFVRSYKDAVPVLGKSSELARQVSARNGLGGEVNPSFVSLQQLN